MSKALESFLNKAQEDGVIPGAIGLGGCGGTSLISSALKSLHIGIPKHIVSTVPSGQTESYIWTSYLILFPSIVDVCGINSVKRVVSSNADAAFSGMVVGKLEKFKDSRDSNEKPTVGLMAKAGADIIVTHVGLTTSGSIGGKTALSMEDSVLRLQLIAVAAHRINPNVLVLYHGGIIYELQG